MNAIKWPSWDIAYLGRAVGALFILAGIGLTSWDLWTTRSHLSSSALGQFYVLQVLSYVFSGSIIMIVSEIVGRIRWAMDAPEAPTVELRRGQDAADRERVGTDPLLRAETLWAMWNDLDVVRLGRASGITIATAGILVSAWVAMTHGQGFVGLGAQQSARAFAENALHYSYQGMLIILLAEVANRVSPWREDVGEAAIDAPEPGSEIS